MAGVQKQQSGQVDGAAAAVLMVIGASVWLVVAFGHLLWLVLHAVLVTATVVGLLVMVGVAGFGLWNLRRWGRYVALQPVKRRAGRVRAGQAIRSAEVLAEAGSQSGEGVTP